MENMKRMKKSAFYVLLMISMVFIFSGCGNNSASSNVEHTSGNQVSPSSPIMLQPGNVQPEPNRPGAVQQGVDNQGQGVVALTPAQIFEYHADAVFTIYVSYDNRFYDSVGSGFFVCPSGIAITNHHVITGWPYAFIRTHSGHEFDIRGFYSYDKGNDLAIIQVEGSNFPYLVMGDSDSLRIGENVFAIGSPLGYHNTFSTGIISRFSDVAEFGIYRVYNMLQITTPISGGSSGGALLDEFGRAIGITTAGYGGAIAQALNFAVPIARVDLSSVNSGQVLQLPIGEVLSINDSDLFGTWIWARGYYTFNPNGSGSREWDGERDTFQWRTSGTVLVLYLPNDEERWLVSVINANEINIGGAFFTREGVLSEVAHTLVGTWDWDRGWYAFEADGTGSRIWDGDSATFRWSVEGDAIIFNIFGAEDEIYTFSTTNANRIVIGGAVFTRR